MKVWIDQDLCTGDGLCEEIAPDVFFGLDDGLFYVKESAGKFGEEKLFDGDANPGEGIFIEVYPALTGADRACLRTNDAGSRTGRSRLSGHRST